MLVGRGGREIMRGRDEVNWTRKRREGEVRKGRIRRRERTKGKDGKTG